MKFIASLLLSLMISTSVFAVAGTEDTIAPLMIIRHNQDVVSYERSLKRAVTTATATKKETFFDVVSVVPTSLKNGQAIAQKHAQRLIQHLQHLGIKNDRIRLSYQDNNELGYTEIHIFAR